MAVGGVLFDIDGVLVTSWEPIAGAAETLRLLDDQRIARSYLTNTTTMTRAQIAGALSAAGMNVRPDEVITAAALTAEETVKVDAVSRELGLWGLDAPEDVGGPARRKADHHPDRLVGPALRRGAPGGGE